MTRQLPSKPSLEQLRKQAKDIHKAHKNADPSCCAVLRHLKPLAGKPDADILKAEVSLLDVQFALAMEYGFKTWAEMKKAIPQNQSQQPTDRPQLSWIPAGKPKWYNGWITCHTRGIELITNHLNGQDATQVDYDTVMGVLGEAFAFQSNPESVERYDEHNDVGWWPLNPLFLTHLDALAGTIGWRLRYMTALPAQQPIDPIAIYRTTFEPSICASIDAGRPCLLGFTDWWSVVTGYDMATPRIIGMCPNVNEGEEKVEPSTFDRSAWWAIIFDGTAPRIPLRISDRETLARAVDLHHDRIHFAPDWQTGVASYKCWMTWLADKKRYSEPAHPHANSKGFLSRNRRTAVRFLRTMADRHRPQIKRELEAAVLHFGHVADTADVLDIRQETIASESARHKLIDQLQAAEHHDRQAFLALGRALELMESDDRKA